MREAVMIAVSAGVTILLRFLPFLLFRGGRKTPPVITYLGKVLPYSVMGMLVVYCLKDTSFSAVSEWLPPLLASCSVVLLYIWRKNTLLSILGGTVLYMLMVQLIF